MNLLIEKSYKYWKEEGNDDPVKVKELVNIIPDNLSDDMGKVVGDVAYNYEKFGFEAGFTVAYKLLSCLKEI